MRRSLSMLLLLSCSHGPAFGWHAAGSGCRASAKTPPSDAGAALPELGAALADGVTLELAPDPVQGDVQVSVTVAGDRAANVREVRVARAWSDTHAAAAVVGPRARDGSGNVALVPRRDDGAPDDVYDLARAPQGGRLVLRYRASATTASTPFALHLTGDRMSAVGHSFLMLPRFDEPARTRVIVRVDRMRRGADAASSFGFGRQVDATATSEDLAHALYVAGIVWREEGASRSAADADELFVLGGPPFDTRRALERAEAARAAIDAYFGRTDRDAMRFFLVGHAGLGRAHEGASLARSVGVWFDDKGAFDAGLGLVVAHEIVHRYLGGAVRLVSPDGREASWFAEGFTVHVARRAMLEADLLSLDELAADLELTFGPSSPLPDDYRRGAALAARLDAAITRATGGASSLKEVLRDLVARGGALPVEALDAAVRSRAPGVEHVVIEGERADVPDGAFGSCAHRRTGEQRAFELGFDARSLDMHPRVLRGVVAGSAAEAAGAREGALVLGASLPDPPHALAGDSVELLLADGTRVRYLPVATRRTGRWEAGELAACRDELRLKAKGR